MATVRDVLIGRNVRKRIWLPHGGGVYILVFGGVAHGFLDASIYFQRQVSTCLAVGSLVQSLHLLQSPSFPHHDVHAPIRLHHPACPSHHLFTTFWLLPTTSWTTTYKKLTFNIISVTLEDLLIELRRPNAHLSTN